MAEEREKQPRHGRHTNNGNSDRTSGDGKISPPDERGDRAASGSGGSSSTNGDLKHGRSAVRISKES